MVFLRTLGDRDILQSSSRRKSTCSTGMEGCRTPSRENSPDISLDAILNRTERNQGSILDENISVYFDCVKSEKESFEMSSCNFIVDHNKDEADEAEDVSMLNASSKRNFVNTKDENDTKQIHNNKRLKETILSSPPVSKGVTEETQRFLDLLELASGRKPASGYSFLKDRIHNLTKKSQQTKWGGHRRVHFSCGLGVKNIVKTAETRNLHVKCEVQLPLQEFNNYVPGKTKHEKLNKNESIYKPDSTKKIEVNKSKVDVKSDKVKSDYMISSSPCEPDSLSKYFGEEINNTTVNNDEQIKETSISNLAVEENTNLNHFVFTSADKIQGNVITEKRCKLMSEINYDENDFNNVTSKSFFQLNNIHSVIHLSSNKEQDSNSEKEKSCLNLDKEYQTNKEHFKNACNNSTNALIITGSRGITDDFNGMNDSIDDSIDTYPETVEAEELTQTDANISTDSKMNIKDVTNEKREFDTYNFEDKTTFISENTYKHNSVDNQNMTNLISEGNLSNISSYNSTVKNVVNSSNLLPFPCTDDNSISSLSTLKSDKQFNNLHHAYNIPVQNNCNSVNTLKSDYNTYSETKDGAFLAENRSDLPVFHNYSKSNLVNQEEQYEPNLHIENNLPSKNNYQDTDFKRDADIFKHAVDQPVVKEIVSKNVNLSRVKEVSTDFLYELSPDSSKYKYPALYYRTRNLKNKSKNELYSYTSTRKVYEETFLVLEDMENTKDSFIENNHEPEQNIKIQNEIQEDNDFDITNIVELNNSLVQKNNSEVVKPETIDNSLDMEDDGGNENLETISHIYNTEIDSVLISAVSKNMPFKVREYLEQNANPNTLCGSLGGTVFHKAASKGYLYVVKALIEGGTHLEASTELGNTALHYAAREGHEKIVFELIKNRANVNAVNVYGVTPLQVAMSYGHIDAMETLLKSNADLKLPDISGESCNDIANRLKYSLLDLKSKLNSVHFFSEETGVNENINESIPLDVQLILAVEKQCSLSVENCLNKGANPNTVVPVALHWPAKATVLHRCAHKGDDILVRLILKAGASIDAQDIVGNTPLHAAAQKGSFLTSKLLIEAGAKLETKSLKGMTPLHRAASKGKDQTAKLLLRKGASCLSQDEEGRTAADWARKRGFKALANKLKNRRFSSFTLLNQVQSQSILSKLTEIYKAAVAAAN